MDNSKASKCIQVSKALRAVDMFPLQLGFTYKQSRLYKTSSSGFFSILTLLLILSYFLYLAKDIWNFKVSLKNSLKKRDVTFDNTTFSMTDYNFDFAFKIQYLGRNSTIASNLNQFASIHMYQVRGSWKLVDGVTVWVPSISFIPIEKCTDAAFSNDTKYLEQMKIVGNYFCPSTRNFQLQGGLSSDEFQSVSIKVKECDQDQLDIFQPGKQCASLQEQYEVISNLMGTIIFSNQYFSGQNKEAPIQNDYKLWAVGTPKGNSFNTFVKLSINEAILEDSWFFSSYAPRNLSYTSLRIDSQYSRSHVPDNPVSAFMNIVVILDENVDVNERTAFNLVMALQSIGGFASVVMAISSIIFNYSQRFNYFQELISQLYSTDDIFIDNRELGQEPSLQQDPYLAQSAKRSNKALGGAQNRGQQLGLEIDSSQQVSRLRTKLYEFAQRQVPVKISRFWYFTQICRKNTKKTQRFNRGQEMLQQELNLANYIKMSRLLKLYLDITLTSVQKTILQKLSQRISLGDRSKDKDQCSNPDSPLFADIDLLTYRESVEKILQKISNGTTSQFDKALLEYLGFEKEEEISSFPRFSQNRSRGQPKMNEQSSRVCLKEKLKSSRRRKAPEKLRITAERRLKKGSARFRKAGERQDQAIYSSSDDD